MDYVSREELAILDKEAIIDLLEVEIQTRLAAQRGLVRWMREHGEGDKIGYDPDQARKIRRG